MVTAITVILSIVAILALIVVCIGLYVLCCFPLHKALDHLGYSTPWLAWIPFASEYAMADYTVGDRDSMVLFGKEVKASYFKFWVAIYWGFIIIWSTVIGVISFILGLIPVVGWILDIFIFIVAVVVGLALTVVVAYIRGLCFAQIIGDVEHIIPKDKLVIGIVSAFIPVVGGIILLIDMNKIKKGEL